MSDWIVRDHDNDNEQTATSRAEADEMAETAREFGSDDVEVVPPSDTATEQTAAQAVEVDAEAEAVEVHDGDTAELDERSVAEDPLNWMPGEFVDKIDGTQAINRKGYEVLSHFYDISIRTDLQVAPEETDHEYCRCKATAETPDGRTVQAFGSSHVDRGDDTYLLLELADTRARKRALAIATGVGAVAVEELQSELQ